MALIDEDIEKPSEIEAEDFKQTQEEEQVTPPPEPAACLLYTSDAADD